MVNPNYQLPNFLQTLEQWGLVDVLLPFILVFAIVFAILQKVKVFGDEAKNINVVVSLVLGLLFVVPHVTDSFPPNMDPVRIINEALPGISIVLIAVVMLLIMFGLFGWKQQDAKVPWVFFIFAVLVVIYFFGAAADWWSGWASLTDFFGEDAVSLVIIILVFALIIWFITYDPKKVATGKGVFNDLSRWLGGK